MGPLRFQVLPAAQVWARAEGQDRFIAGGGEPTLDALARL